VRSPYEKPATFDFDLIPSHEWTTPAPPKEYLEAVARIAKDLTIPCAVSTVYKDWIKNRRKESAPKLLLETQQWEPKNGGRC
jgi:hypothetical protein